jgi:flagella basal body P-ring formation protein FlgA
VLLHFRQQAVVEKPRIYLADVAACEGYAGGPTKQGFVGEDICDESYGVDLGASPAPGNTAKISVEVVLEALKKEFPGIDVATSGARAVKVTASAEQLTEAQILPYLRDALAAFNQQLQNFEVRVERVIVPTTAKVRPGTSQFDFPELASAKMPQSELVRKFAGTHPLQVELNQGQEAAEVIPGLRADYRLFVKLPLATRNIAKGETLIGTMIDWEWLPYRATGHGTLLPRQGLISRRSIRRGAVLAEPDFQQATLVARGTPVKLELSKGGVVIRQGAVALENGAEGQYIEVAIGKKKYRAKVINSELVRHEL